VFGTGTMKLVDVGNVSVFAFVRENADEAWLVVENLTESEQSVSAEVAGDKLERALGKGKGRREGGKVVVDLPATESFVARIR
jgi:hypothetical protein